MSEFDKVDVCVRCAIRSFCNRLPDDMSCEDAKNAAKASGFIFSVDQYGRAVDEQTDLDNQ